MDRGVKGDETNLFLGKNIFGVEKKQKRKKESILLMGLNFFLKKICSLGFCQAGTLTLQNLKDQYVAFINTKVIESICLYFRYKLKQIIQVINNE